MTPQAQRADVLQIALPAALRYRHNVVRIPKALAGPGLQSPMLQQRLPAGSPRVTQPSRLDQRVHAASGADTLVPLEHLIAHITRLGA